MPCHDLLKLGEAALQIEHRVILDLILGRVSQATSSCQLERQVALRCHFRENLVHRARPFEAFEDQVVAICGGCLERLTQHWDVSVLMAAKVC